MVITTTHFIETKLKWLTVCLCLVVCMNSCGLLFYPTGTLGRNQHYEAQAVLCSGVPYYYDWGDDAERFDKVRILETDSQGRQLFEYICTASYYWDTITIWVICQHTTDDVVYYYEDVAYRLAPSSDTQELPDTELEMLKKQNDWDAPLNLDKAYSVSFPYSNTLNTNKNTATRTIKEYFSLDDTWSVGFDDLEIYDTGKRVLIVRLYTNLEIGVEYQTSYLVVYEQLSDVDGNILASQSYEEGFNCQDVIHQFKIEHGLIG